MSGKKPEYKQQLTAAGKIKKTNKYAYLFVPLLLVLADYVAVLCAEQLSFTLRNYLITNNGVLRITPFTFFVITPVIYLFFLHIFELYSRQAQFWRIIAGIFNANLYAIITCIVLLYILHIGGNISRLYVGMLGIFSFLFIVGIRYLIKFLFVKLHVFEEAVLLLGAGRTARNLLYYISSDVGMNYRFIGYLEDNTPNAEVAAQLPCLGRFSDAIAVIKKTGVKRVLVTAPRLEPGQLQNIIYDVQPLVNSVAFIPDTGNMPLSNVDFESLVDGRVMMFQIRNNLRSRWNRLLKFTFDWCLTLAGTICISPILLAIGIWVYRDSPGPIIFKHRRIGKNGREFACYKFRSMCADADIKLKELLETDPQARAEWDRDFKLKDDPRITKSGAFLRRTSLDELPQIFNVLKGEMSLVGPRPIIREEIPRYGKYIKDYYMVRPGITGMWQTSGRSDIDYDERVQMDTWYVRNWNIWFDIVLLWRTFKVVINGKGAY